MKTFTNLKTTVSGSKVTITGDIVERQFTLPVQQVTIGFFANGNRQWIQHAQISQEAIFFKRLGVGFAIPIEEFNDKVAKAIEPKLTFPPLFRKTTTDLQVDFVSELQPTLQWECAEELNGEWKAVEGQTAKQLDPAKLPFDTCWVRCRASSEAGSSLTPAFEYTK